MPNSTLMLLAIFVVGLMFARFVRRGFQFSLRSLLVTMTLAAVFLGLVHYLGNRPPAMPPLTHGDFEPTRQFTH